MTTIPRGRAGSTLVLNVLIMAVFAMTAVIVYASARSQVHAVVHDAREAQAQAIAEAGLEDAMHGVYMNPLWRTGFYQKPFAGGYYTVSLSTEDPPYILSTGYSAPLLLTGRAVKTVGAKVQFTAGSCPYAVMADKALKIEGKVDAYDITTTLTPSATQFITGANVRSNNNVSVLGAACPPAHVLGDVIGQGSVPAASCVTGSVSLTTVTLPLANFDCPTCEAVNDNLTGISPSSAYNNGAQALTVNAGQTVTLSSGTFFFKKITINGTLNVNTSSGSAAIYVKNNFFTGANCQFNNTSKIPARVHFYSTNPGNVVKLNCVTPFHAYLEGSQAQFNLAQELYGHFCADSVEISSNTTDGYGRVHYDMGGGGLVDHVSWTTGVNGSWTESYTRQ
ncbi:MAG: hypothetical protein HYX59_12385 [Elusimicrobia bacterium]|nr:hypothetical protein [Elusimicrobiota bacterium]